MGKIYPIDIAGVNNIGVEEWVENYYIPVTGKEFYTIYKEVLDTYISSFRKLEGTEIYWVAVSNLRLPMMITVHILKYLTFKRLTEKGYKYLISFEKGEIPDDILSHTPSIFDDLSVAKRHIFGLTTRGRIKNILRTIGYNIKPFNKNFLGNILQPNYLIGSRYRQEAKAYLEEKAINPLMLSPYIFLKRKSKRHEFNEQLLNEINNFINDFLILIKKKYPDSLSETAFERLFVELKVLFDGCLQVFYQNLKRFKKLKSRRPLISTYLGFSNPVYPLFLTAWRYAGGQVIGFPHGNNYCHGYTHWIMLNLSLVTDYIAYSPGHEKLVTHGVYKYSHGFNVPKITHFRTNYNSLIFKKLQSFPSVKKIKRVMINGSIIGGYYPMNTEYHAFAFLHCELKIVKVLRDAGYYVLYKPRPKSYHEVARIFRKYADEVLGGKFEDVYQSADCLLFVSHYSTTFGFSLLTNKPIVLLNVKGYTWYPRVFELTKKRCSVVEANPVDGRIVFDEQDVLNAVQESVNNINYDILHEFAF